MSEAIKVGIKIMPRDVILDTQGRAVELSMKNNGYHLESCRVGKFIELEFNSDTFESAKKQAVSMLTEGGLYNPLIEKFEIQNESFLNQK